MSGWPSVPSSGSRLKETSLRSCGSSRRKLQRTRAEIRPPATRIGLRLSVDTAAWAHRNKIGAELFHQTAESQGMPASTSLGIGWRYDLTDNYHLLGYVRRGIENTDETNRYSWYASVLFTF